MYVLHVSFPATPSFRYNRSKSIIEGELPGSHDAMSRQPRHSDTTLLQSHHGNNNVYGDRGPLHIPSDRIGRQVVGAGSAESLVEQV